MLNRNTALLGLFVLIIGLAAGIYFGREHGPKVMEQPTLSADVKTVSFTLSDLDGNSRHSDEWSGKGLIVNFWATWCAPCRREIPLLIETQAEQAENNIQIIGVAVEDPEPVAALAAETDFNYPILVGQQDAIDLVEDNGIEFRGLPLTLVIAPSGDLLKAHLGEIHAADIDAFVEAFNTLAAGDTSIDAIRQSLGAF